MRKQLLVELKTPEYETSSIKLQWHFPYDPSSKISECQKFVDTEDKTVITEEEEKEEQDLRRQKLFQRKK